MKKYKHDCDDCEYLGSSTENNEYVEFYKCNKELQSYIARYGDDLNYISIPETLLPVTDNNNIDWRIAVLKDICAIRKSDNGNETFCIIGNALNNEFKIVFNPFISSEDSSIIENAAKLSFCKFIGKPVKLNTARDFANMIISRIKGGDRVVEFDEHHKPSIVFI